MPSLKEIKGRIGSVKSTLKITSAMKLVASAKLRKAQQTIEGMRPYERKLQDILSRVMEQCGPTASLSGVYARKEVQTDAEEMDAAPKQKIALVAFASNSSLCGAFNANVVRLALETVRSYGDADVTVYSVGRKMAESMKKIGKPSPEDFQKLADKPAYAPAAELAECRWERFLHRLRRFGMTKSLSFRAKRRNLMSTTSLNPPPPNSWRTSSPNPCG